MLKTIDIALMQFSSQKNLIRLIEHPIALFLLYRRHWQKARMRRCNSWCICHWNAVLDKLVMLCKLTYEICQFHMAWMWGNPWRFIGPAEIGRQQNRICSKVHEPCLPWWATEGDYFSPFTLRSLWGCHFLAYHTAWIIRWLHQHHKQLQFRFAIQPIH